MVSVRSSPNGLPIATVGSPTWTARESPSSSGVAGRARRARPAAARGRCRVLADERRGDRVVVGERDLGSSVASSTTCALVRISPSSSSTKPEPVDSRRRGSCRRRRTATARSRTVRARTKTTPGARAAVDLARAERAGGARRASARPCRRPALDHAACRRRCRRRPAASSTAAVTPPPMTAASTVLAQLRIRAPRVGRRALKARLKGPKALRRPPVSSRQAASMSGARISVSPIRTASTPTRSSSSSCSRVEKPDSETTVLPAGTSASSS